MLFINHDRFEYSEQREVITRENPLSYHNLGLAVQSSFIEPGRIPVTHPHFDLKTLVLAEPL